MMQKSQKNLKIKTFFPATSHEWLDKVYNKLMEHGIKPTQSITLVLFVINREAIMKGHDNNLKITHHSCKFLPLSSQSVSRALMDLNNAGVIQLDKGIGRAPLIDLIIKPVHTDE